MSFPAPCGHVLRLKHEFEGVWLKIANFGGLEDGDVGNPATATESPGSTLSSIAASTGAAKLGVILSANQEKIHHYLRPCIILGAYVL